MLNLKKSYFFSFFFFFSIFFHKKPLFFKLSDKNLTILEPRSAAPVLMRPYSNNSNNNSDEGDNSNDFPVRKDSLTDQINKNIENVFK